MPIKRGDIYFVDLDPVVGRELGKKERPVIVLSINDINMKPLVVSVIPGTTTPSQFRNTVQVEPGRSNGLKKDTYFQCHQLRALDHTRFNSQRVGVLSAAEITKIESAVKFSLGLS